MTEILELISSPIIAILLLPVGFLGLIKGANYLVEGSSSVAKRFDVSDLVIGLTIVAFGTSLPELLVTFFASLSGSSDLAIGNVIGSNISNILLILGICAVIYPLSVSKGTVWKEIPLNFLAVMALFALANDELIEGVLPSQIGRIDGFVLMMFFVIFVYYSFGIAKQRLVSQMEETGADVVQDGYHEMSIPKTVLFIVFGIILLPIGGQLVINGGVTIARLIGLSESFIGLTVLALGTSAPELATSAVATYKRNASIAIGNIVGSNLFNIFWILGISSAFVPIQFNPQLNTDLIICGLATLFLFLFIAIKNVERNGRRLWWPFAVEKEQNILSRTEGIVFLIFYAAYLIFLVWRG